MESSNGSGGYINERMREVEAMLKQVAADHQLFLQEHQLLLRAQVVFQDSMQQLEKKMSKLAESQQATDERISILVNTVDSIIRSQSK